MNNSGNIKKSILAAVLAIVILMGMQIAVTILYGVTHSTSITDALQSVTSSSTASDNASITLIANLISCVLFLFIYGRWYTVRFIRPYAGHKRTTPRGFSLLTILTLIILGFGLQLIFQLVLNLEAKIMPSLYQNYMTSLSSFMSNQQMLLLVIAYTVILAPIAEELIFRGVIYRFARLNMPFWGANILQAAFFGLYHMNLVQGIYAFILGLFLGYIASKGRGIRYSIVLHIIINFLSIFMLTFIEGLSALLPKPSLIIGIALTVFAIFAFRFEFKPIRKRLAKDTEYDEDTYDLDDSNAIDQVRRNDR